MLFSQLCKKKISKVLRVPKLLPHDRIPNPESSTDYRIPIPHPPRPFHSPNHPASTSLSVMSPSRRQASRASAGKAMTTPRTTPTIDTPTADESYREQKGVSGRWSEMGMWVFCVSCVFFFFFLYVRGIGVWVLCAYVVYMREIGVRMLCNLCACTCVRSVYEFYVYYACVYVCIAVAVLCGMCTCVCVCVRLVYQVARIWSIYMCFVFMYEVCA